MSLYLQKDNDDENKAIILSNLCNKSGKLEKVGEIAIDIIDNKIIETLLHRGIDIKIDMSMKEIGFQVVMPDSEFDGCFYSMDFESVLNDDLNSK